ncbi:MAG TPA: extracellular solute-binding protein [Thermomicrobiales bacterium]|nr:extracellular solute-binding protein [Thermomicrobiales bacterium]
MLDRRLNRRGLLSLALAGTSAIATGCTPRDSPASTVQPSETPVPSPTATQETIASPVAGFVDVDRWAGRVMTVASLGGNYQAAQAEAYFKPFEVATGVTIRQDTAVLGDVQRQVDDDAVIWDVVCLPTEEVLPLARASYLTPIDYSVIDTSTLLTETGIVMQHGVGADFFSTVIIYPIEAERVPEGWADFWDVKRFGAGRALKKDPVGTLEFALLASGVPRDQLYPLDVERAFASLALITPDVVIWYEDSKQPIELILADEIQMASAWNVRTALPDALGKFGITWQGGMLSGDSWVVPRRTKNADLAMSFISYATRAVPNANFCRLLPFGPVNRESLDFLRPDTLRILPTAIPHLSEQFVENWNYWVDNRERLTARFNEWLETHLATDNIEE